MAEETNLLSGLIQTRQGLLDKYGSLMAEAQIALNDLNQVEDMLARYGYYLNVPLTSPDEEAQPEQQPLLAQADIAAETAAQGQETIDQTAERLIRDHGVPFTAMRYIEWRLRTKQSPNPSTVQHLFDTLTPALRVRYNADSTVGVEALRAQIKTRIASGDAQLYYEKGNVYLSEREQLEAQPA